MTTKPEQPAHASESGLVPEAGPQQGMPSVIVDPSALSAPSPIGAEGAPPAAGDSDAPHVAGNGALASHVEASSTAPPAPGAGAESLELSDFEADRFAASFRPSWEPSEPATQGGVQQAPTAAGPEPQGNGVATTAPAEIADPVVVPGTARRRGVMLTALAVVAFGGLVAAAIVSTGDPTPPASATPVAKPEPPATEPSAKPSAPLPEPTPSAAPVPSAPAAPELAAASAGAPAAAPPTEALAPPAEPTAAASPLAAPAPPPAAAPTPAPEVAPPPPAVPTVHVRIEAVPPEATITIDGQPVPNPYDAEVEKSGKHRVVVSAPGHKGQDQLVGFDRKRDFVIRLKALPSEPKPKAEAPRVASTPRAPKTRPRPARPAPAAKTPAPSTSKPPAPSTKGAAFVSESPY